MNMLALENAMKILNRDGESNVDLAIILGSGLGNLIDWLENPKVFNCRDIPGFVESTAPSHAGKLMLGKFNGVKICLKSIQFLAQVKFLIKK